MAGGAIIQYGVLGQPRQIRLDLTTACNAKCLSCHRFTTRRQAHMTLEQVEHILQEIATWETPLQEIVPVNYGEFFCYAEWREVLALLQSYLPRTHIALPTNGSLLTPELAMQYLVPTQTLKVLNFSVNAIVPETYEAFTGFDYSVVHQIQQTAAKIRQARPDMIIWFSMVFDPLYQSEIEKEVFFHFWKQHGEPQILAAANCGRSPLKIRTRQPCRSIFSDMVLGADGKVGSCCFDAGFRLDLGYVNGSILEAWRSSAFDQLRIAHNNGGRQQFEVCRDCSYA